MRSTKVTRKDVAVAAGVSPALVSFVLNNYKQVHPDTRARVLDAIRTLGYEPNLAARSLRTSRTGQIAFLMPDITNLFFADVALAIEEAAREAGYSVILSNSGSQPESALHALKRWRVEGVIVSAVPGEMVRELTAAGIKVVSILRAEACAGFNTS